MSYLSRRMREDRWPRRRPGELTLTVTVDIAHFAAALDRTLNALRALVPTAELDQPAERSP